MPSIIHISDPGGHRASYRDLLALELGYQVETGPAKRFYGVLFRSTRVLFATLDGDIDRFLLIAFARSLLFKRTGGLFIGPLRFLEKPTSFRQRMRGWGLSVVRLMPFVTVYSIIPHPVRPQLAQVTNSWIHDPQLWDLGFLGMTDLPKTKLSTRVATEKGKRKVLLYLGQGSIQKGLSELTRHTGGFEQELLVVVAGRVLDECKDDAHELVQRGMIVEDRFISDQELLSLYGVADLAWCAYRKTYDQASGIFGRAIQLGVAPIIRAGSVLDDYATFIDVPAVRFNEDIRSILEAFTGGEEGVWTVDAGRRAAMIEGFRKDALLKICQALGEYVVGEDNSMNTGTRKKKI